MILAKNVTKQFGDSLILKGISTTLEKGKINLIIGQSGSGKTVFLKCLVGLHPITSGEIYYEGRLFTQLNIEYQREIRKEMGMLFQGSALFDYMTVEENVMFPLDMYTDMFFEEKKDRVNNCLKRVNLTNTNKLFPSEISGGMQKRVAIARAIVMNPKYLFCDEPTSGLDPKTSVVIDNLIKELTEEYNTVTVINTHDFNSVIEIGEKVIFIYQGNKWWEGSREDIFTSDNTELNDFIFASKMARGYKQNMMSTKK
jgi:phospholipid/cholesterol/gamma-HCH transport system ATP-binding protein